MHVQYTHVHVAKGCKCVVCVEGTCVFGGGRGGGGGGGRLDNLNELPVVEILLMA